MSWKKQKAAAGGAAGGAKASVSTVSDPRIVPILIDDGKTTDMTVRFTLTRFTGVVPGYVSLIFRGTDVDNYFRFGADSGYDGHYRMVRRSGGVETTVATKQDGSLIPVNGDRVKVVCSGTNIRAYVNDVQIFNVNHQAAWGDLPANARKYGLVIGGGNPATTAASDLTADSFPPINTVVNQAKILTSLLRSQGVVVYDSFDRDDNLNSLSYADTGQRWISLRGVWGISGNQAMRYDGTGEQLSVVMDEGLADCKITATFSKISLESRIVFRAKDADNLYQLKHMGGSYSLRKIENGGTTYIGSYTAPTADGDIATITLNGPNVNILINGKQALTITDTSLATQTKHGFGSYGVVSVEKFDDFKMEVLG